jgi:capsule polysaccharide export protein KpsE/RkpR
MTGKAEGQTMGRWSFKKMVIVAWFVCVILMILYLLITQPDLPKGALFG